MDQNISLTPYLSISLSLRGLKVTEDSGKGMLWRIMKPEH